MPFQPAYLVPARELQSVNNAKFVTVDLCSTNPFCSPVITAFNNPASFLDTIDSKSFETALRTEIGLQFAGVTELTFHEFGKISVDRECENILILLLLAERIPPLYR